MNEKEGLVVVQLLLPRFHLLFRRYLCWFMVLFVNVVDYCRGSFRPRDQCREVFFIITA